MTPTKLLIGQILLVFGIVIAPSGFRRNGLPASSGISRVSVRLVRNRFLSRLSAVATVRMVVRLRALCAGPLQPRRRHGGGGRYPRVIVAIAGSLWRARQTRFVTTYGSSRWATRREVEKAGLFNPAGVFLGTLKHRYLRHDGPEHIMCFAPTRSGKGVGLVIPTLLSWPHSAVIHDIKGENWQLTSGWRGKFSHCLLFNPTDPASAKYNPLLEVRKGRFEVRDVQNIADILVDPEGSLERRTHWEKTGHSLLVGVILHVLYAEEDKTLARVAAFLSDPSRSFERTLRVMMSTNHLGTDGNPQVHPVVAQSARELLNKATMNARASCRPPCRFSGSIAIQLWRRRQALRLAHRRSRRRRSSGLALPRCSPLGFVTDQTACSPCAESDRAQADRALAGR